MQTRDHCLTYKDLEPCKDPGAYTSERQEERLLQPSPPPFNCASSFTSRPYAKTLCLGQPGFSAEGFIPTLKPFQPAEAQGSCRARPLERKGRLLGVMEGQEVSMSGKGYCRQCRKLGIPVSSMREMGNGRNTKGTSKGTSMS